MFATAVFLVILSGLLHAVWNLYAKQSLNKAVFLWSCQWVAVAVYLPWAVSAVAERRIPAAGWGFLAAAASLHGMYTVLLSRTYTAGDLSQVYPLMRGVSPLLTPIIGVWMLGERLTPPGWGGVGCIVAGVWILGNWRLGGRNGVRPPARSAAWLALTVGLSITLYTALDKIALDYIPAVTLNDAGNLGNLAALSWTAVRSGAIAAEWLANWKAILLGGVIAPGGYLLFLLALHVLPLAQLAPMREVGTVFGAILGVAVLKEAQGKRRIAAAGLIALGAVLLGVFG